MPKEALLGDPDVKVEKGFAGAMQTFDNTRPLVAGMAVGVARAALEETREQLAEAGVEIDYSTPGPLPAGRGGALPRDGGRLRGGAAAHPAGRLDGRQRQAELAAGLDGEGEGGRTCVDVALGCVELCGSVGYGESELLEKWARDAKILDIFEGTQQIQLLIVARQLLGKSSAELR